MRRLICVSAGVFAHAIALFLALAATSAAYAQVLRFAAIPEEPQAVIQQRFAPLMRYLESRGLTAVWVPMPDMPAFIDAIVSKRVDFIWTNGFSYALARQRMGGNLIPIAQRSEDAQFKSVFVSANESVKALADITGKTIIFGPASSASGHLMPRHFLISQSPGTLETAKATKFSSSQEAVVWRIAADEESVGVVNEAVWERMGVEGKLPKTQLKVFHTTPTFFDYCFAIPADRDPALITALQNALIGLDPRRADNLPILRAMRASRIITSTEENYTALEGAAVQAGLIKK
jgi:phosphonate transport system substrate-binding protein